MSKVAKSKEKNPRQKMERPENVLRSETTNRDTAFKITIRGKSPLLNGLLFEVIFTVFVPRLILANREGNLVFNIMYGKFWFDGDFFVPEIWTPVRSSASTSPFHKKVPFYFSWQNGTFFLRWAFFLLFLFFFYLRLSSAFNFSMRKDFSISRDATCEFYTNKRKIHFSASEGWK